MADDGLEQARQLYERATFGGDPEALALAGRVLDGVEAGLALARGRLLHARFLETGTPDAQELDLFEGALRRFSRLGDARGQGEALLWIGIYHQVVRRDDVAARPPLERAGGLAKAAADDLTLSYVRRHLAFADQAEGLLELAREGHESSVRLRYQLGFMPGVAAGMLALAELAAAEGRREDALGMLDEAESLAVACDAQGVRAHVAHVRAELERD
ncbi:MAG TPA: hypothetical protein VGF46_12820 [Gaiellales bacterium]